MSKKKSKKYQEEFENATIRVVRDNPHHAFSLKLAEDIEKEISEPKQKFTGYWIPVELTRLGLTKIEQFLLSIIDSLESEAPEYCFASNRYLAKQMELSESRVSFYITKLKRMGLIEEVGFDGRHRRLRTLKENWYKRKEQISKKELCVKTRSHTTRKQEVTLRENANHIENSYNTANNPPLSSPPEKKKAKNKDISLRSEEEETAYSILDKTNLNPKDKLRLTKSYTEEQVARALSIAETQPIKKSLMSLLINILDNPDKWPDKAETKPVTQNQQIALQYNQRLRKVNQNLAKENDTLIENNALKVMFKEGIWPISLNSDYFIGDMKQANTVLDGIESETKPDKGKTKP